jgi:hypothetical protein
VLPEAERAFKGACGLPESGDQEVALCTGAGAGV